MVRCPKCGSTRFELGQTEYEEDGWSIEVIHTYKCGCGCTFTGTSYFHCQDCCETIKEIKSSASNK